MRPHVYLGFTASWRFVQSGGKRVWLHSGLSSVTNRTRTDAKNDGGRGCFSEKVAREYLRTFGFKDEALKEARKLIREAFRGPSKPKRVEPKRTYYLGTDLAMKIAKSVTVFRTGQKFAEIRVWSHIGKSDQFAITLERIVEDPCEYYVKTHSRAEAREFFKASKFVHLIP